MMKQRSRYASLGLLALVLCLLSGGSLWAQDSLRTISGKILDEKSEALLGASVSLLQPDGKLKTGAVSAKDGSFLLKHVARGSYTLRVTFVGYKTHTQSLQVAGSNLPLAPIKLEGEGELLEGVKVVGKTSDVVIKGDTIEFHAGNFTTNQGAVVADLIKKLPGASIDENGKITINGKTISQIMVDGKRFFEGDPKVAANNLPADLVEKVQVLDRDSEAARLSGFSDGNEETVINLTIKAGKKKGLFGTAYAGAGTSKRYEANLTLSRFADDNQFTVIGGLNNTNNAGFSDISSEGNQMGFLMGMGAGRRGNRGGAGGPPRRDANGILTSKMLGGNISHTLSSKLQINANALGGRNTTNKLTDRWQQNYLATGSTTETGKSTERSDKDAYGANIRMEWKPDSLTEIIISPELRYGHSRGVYSSTAKTLEDATSTLINSSTLTQQTLLDNINGTLRLDGSRRLSASGRTLTLSARLGLENEDGDGKYIYSLYDRTSAASQDVDQRIDSRTHGLSYQARLGWVEPLGKGFFSQLTYQIKGSESRSSRDAYDADLTGAYTVHNATYSNEFRSDYLTHQVGLALKRKGTGYDLTAGVNVESSRISSHSVVAGVSATPLTRTTLNFSPTLRLSFKPQRGTELRLDYFGRSFAPTNEQLSPVQDVTNPLISYVGNQDLLPGFQHNLFGRFSKYWTKSQTSLSLFGRGQVVQHDIIQRSLYDVTSGKRTVDYTNVDGNASLGLGGFLTQTLPGKKFSLRLASFNDLARSHTYINGEKNRSISLRLREELGLNFRTTGIDMTLKGGFGYYNASNSLPSAVTPATKDYSLGYTTNLTLPLGFAFEGEATYTTSRGYAAGYNQDQLLLSAGLSYSFLAGKKATIRLKGYDLLNSRRSIYQSITAMSSTLEESNTLGRYAMLHFIYRFDSFSGGASRSDLKRQGPPGPPPF